MSKIWVKIKLGSFYPFFFSSPFFFCFHFKPAQNNFVLIKLDFRTKRVIRFKAFSPGNNKKFSFVKTSCIYDRYRLFDVSIMFPRPYTIRTVILFNNSCLLTLPLNYKYISVCVCVFSVYFFYSRSVRACVLYRNNI